MDTPASIPLPENPVEPVDRSRLLSTLAVAGALAWLADFLFWKSTPGISLAIYVCAIAIVIVLLNPPAWKNPRIRIAGALMLVASSATAQETSFTNISVLLALLAVIGGECWYGALSGSWARWSESLVAWIAAPGRWPWLARELEKTPWATLVFSEKTGAKATRLFQILAPALWFALIFGVLLGFGNAVFSEFISRVGNAFINWISGFDFSFGHLMFYLLFGTLGLAWAHPRPAPGKTRFWARKLQRISRVDPWVAIWQSRLILLVLNVLFFIVNTIDVFYLWEHAALPTNVNFSQFVHEGVFSLLIAVVLSALLIAVIFQQEAQVKNARFMKGFAMLWIVQNVALIAGVFLRLKLYVVAYQLSEQRVYVGCFLLLVVAGFVLLALHVARDGNINTLIFRNMLATFALFFIIQFANVGGWVAHYNMARWKSDPKRTLDLDYLASLGPDAWPALVEVAAMNDNSETSTKARAILGGYALQAENRIATFDWRSWQARRDRRSPWLIAQSRKYPSSGL